MSFADKRKHSLSSRLTASYALLFSALLLILTIAVFLSAYFFLTKRQAESLSFTGELIADHIIEELEEGETLSEPDLLEELNSDRDMNLALYDMSGRLMSQVRNFPFDEKAFPTAENKPVLVFSSDTMLLCEVSPLEYGGQNVGELRLVLNMGQEYGFLRVLAFLLIGANVVGACVALVIGWRTSKRMLAPIGSMINEAQLIGSEDLGARLAIPAVKDELQSLALTINGMLERMETAFEQQGRFTADASHELRTPLAILQGNADLLRRWGRDDPKVLDESIESITGQVEYMNRLVENLLFLTRSDSGRGGITRELFDINELFEEIVAEQAVIDLDHTFCSNTSLVTEVYADKSMIKQLLRAFIDNSMKYTPAGGSISLDCTKNEYGLELSVSDDGVGMERQELERIFERFYRVDQARARESGGYGLGLSIAMAIARLHGGTIRAESEKGRGTRMTVFLPVPLIK